MFVTASDILKTNAFFFIIYLTSDNRLLTEERKQNTHNKQCEITCCPKQGMWRLLVFRKKHQNMNHLCVTHIFYENT